MSPAKRVHYQHSLDTSLPVRASAGVVRLKGWCFTAGGDARPQIQLRIGALVLTTIADDHRADVAAAFPGISHAAYSGFEITGHVPAGISVAELWAGRDGFGWEQLISFSIFGEAAILHGAIDLPLEKELTHNRSIDGWCFHPQRDIAELWLHYGTQSVRCRHYGHERRDVAGQYAHLPQARHCGFSSDEILRPGEGRIRLRAVDREGGVYFCETTHFVRITPGTPNPEATDPRLDGRALFRSCSIRQATLPPLQVVIAASAALETADVRAVLDNLSTLPADNWRLVVITDNPVSPELQALVESNSHLVCLSSSPTEPDYWTLELRPGDLPDPHGLMAALIAAADRPDLKAVCGDFSSGPDQILQVQPPWSHDLALAGGIHPWTPLLVAGGRTFGDSSAVLTLAGERAQVVHIRARLVRRLRASSPESDNLEQLLIRARPDAQPSTKPGSSRISYEPLLHFKRPAITAIVAGTADASVSLQAAFEGEVDEWLFTGSPESGPAHLASAGEQARHPFLLFLTAATKSVSDKPVTRLALQLSQEPRRAASPLLLRSDLAPWTEVDFFSKRTCRTLQAFDPAFSSWLDRRLALFTRHIPYLPLPGLLIAKARLLELGNFDQNYTSMTASLLDLAFRLRAAGTPPLLCADARLIAPAATTVALSSFEETLLLDRWDQREMNQVRIRPLVPVEVLA